MKFRLKSFLIAIVLLFGFMGFGFSQVTQDSKADELPSSLGALFSQASVNPESMREVVDLRKNSPTTQAMVVWYVTLLFLTFAAAADFYRHRMSTDDMERAEDFDELESVNLRRVFTKQYLRNTQSSVIITDKLKSYGVGK